MPIESILKQNKELISNSKDLSRKISSLEEPVSVANQCVIGELSSVTKGSNCYNPYRNLQKNEMHCDSLSSKLNGKEEM